MKRLNRTRSGRAFFTGAPNDASTFRIETDLLAVRPWTEADRDAFRRMNADPRVMRFFPSVLSEAESDAFLARIQDHQAEHGFTLWAVEDKNGNLAGLTGLARVRFEAPFTPCVEIGWRFLPDYWGRGYALDAARGVLDYAFNGLSLPEVVAFTTATNLPSQRLMQRLGMLRNPAEDFDHPGLPPDHPLRRHVLYRMLRDFWE